MDILKDLDSGQIEAVMQTDGPVLILAGAGSGKTRVLTYKVAYLISQGVNPGNIICVTFTNKAANEMKSRVIRLSGHQGKTLPDYLTTRLPNYHLSALSMLFAPNFCGLTASTSVSPAVI